MIITKVYIENFGKFSAFSYDFDKGYNKIVAENGFGKTTLVTFIKVMLYGFSNKGVKDLVKNERRKYTPWQGGKYGGYIEFIVGGESYRLEKFFGKTEKDDVVTLYNLRTGKTENLNGEIGEQIFEIDVDAFSRTIYFPENETQGLDNISIQSKLNNGIENVQDMSDYKNAISVLDDRRKELLKNGGGGKINQTKNEIDEITRQIDVCTNNEELIKRYKDEMGYLTREIEKLDAEKLRLNNYIQSNQRQLELIAKQWMK